jgi:hypothetical protein
MDNTTIGHVGRHMERGDTSFGDFGTQISGVADLIYLLLSMISFRPSLFRPSTMLNNDYKEIPKRQ